MQALQMTATMIKTLQHLSSKGTVRALSQKHQHRAALHTLRDRGYVIYACRNDWWGFWPTDKAKSLA